MRFYHLLTAVLSILCAAELHILSEIDQRSTISNHGSYAALDKRAGQGGGRSSSGGARRPGSSGHSNGGSHSSSSTSGRSRPKRFQRQVSKLLSEAKTISLARIKKITAGVEKATYEFNNWRTERSPAKQRAAKRKMKAKGRNHLEGADGEGILVTMTYEMSMEIANTGYSEAPAFVPESPNARQQTRITAGEKNTGPTFNMLTNHKFLVAMEPFTEMVTKAQANHAARDSVQSGEGKGVRPKPQGSKDTNTGKSVPISTPFTVQKNRAFKPISRESTALNEVAYLNRIGAISDDGDSSSVKSSASFGELGAIRQVGQRITHPIRSHLEASVELVTWNPSDPHNQEAQSQAQSFSGIVAEPGAIGTALKSRKLAKRAEATVPTLVLPTAKLNQTKPREYTKLDGEICPGLPAAIAKKREQDESGPYYRDSGNDNYNPALDYMSKYYVPELDFDNEYHPANPKHTQRKDISSGKYVPPMASDPRADPTRHEYSFEFADKYFKFMTTRKPVPTATEEVEETATQSSEASDNQPDSEQEQLKEYAALYAQCQDQVAELIWPTIENVLAVANADVVYMMALSIYSDLTGSQVTVSSPFFMGMHNFDALEDEMHARGVDDGNMQNMLRVDALLIDAYEKAWKNATDALEGTDLLELMMTLRDFLTPEDDSLWPDDLMNEKLEWDPAFDMFLPPEGYQITPELLLNGAPKTNVLGESTSPSDWKVNYTHAFQIEDIALVKLYSNTTMNPAYTFAFQWDEENGDTENAKYSKLDAKDKENSDESSSISTAMDTATDTATDTAMESATGTQTATSATTDTAIESVTGTQTGTAIATDTAVESATGTATNTAMESATGTQTATATSR